MPSRTREFNVCIIGGGVVGTQLGRLLVARGRRVAILERGPRNLSAIRPARPAVQCAERWHAGVGNGRNQVLGGNAHFWGGGLMRSDGKTVHAALGLSEPDGGGEDLVAHFNQAERSLGLHHALLRAPLGRNIEGLGRCDVAEIAVLSGRARNVTLGAPEAIESSPGSTIFCDVSDIRITRLSASGRVEEIEFTIPGVTERLVADVVVVSAGVVDSILFFASHRAQLKLDERVGVAIHDHLSVPLFRMKPDPSGSLARAIAPTFEDGVIVGRHFEMERAAGWGARGFLHFQFHFDDISPYREIKRILSLRQQGADALATGTSVIRMMAQIGRLAEIGYSRFLKHRLHLSPAVPIVATLDFETYPTPVNRLAWAADGQPTIWWDIRSEDVATFSSLAERARRLVADFCARHGASAVPLADWSTARAAESYLQRVATDAYHLGGGLPAGGDERDSVVDLNLKVRGIENMYAVSSAVFTRPGVANPTLTLLALANRLAMQLV